MRRRKNGSHAGTLACMRWNEEKLKKRPHERNIDEVGGMHIFWNSMIDLSLGSTSGYQCLVSQNFVLRRKLQEESFTTKEDMAPYGFFQIRATYKRGLATVEAQLITYRKNEVLFSEEVAVLKRESHEFKGYGPENSNQESNVVCDKKISDNSKENSDESLVEEQISQDKSSFVESSLNVDKETAGREDTINTGGHTVKVLQHVGFGDLLYLNGASLAFKDTTTLMTMADPSSGPRCQDTILGDVDAQTRFEITSKQSNDPPLSRGYTLGDQLGGLMKLLGIDEFCTQLQSNHLHILVLNNFGRLAKVQTVRLECVSTSLSWIRSGLLLRVQGIGRERSSLRLMQRYWDCLPTATIFKELARMGEWKDFSGRITPLYLDTMWFKLVKKWVLDLGKAKDAQAKEITALKKRIQKLERKKKSRPTGLKRLKKIGMSRRVESSEDRESLGDPKDASKQGRILVLMRMPVKAKSVIEKDEQSTKLDDSTAGEAVTTASVEGSTTPTTIKEITLAQTLIQIKAAKPKVVTTAATTTTTTRPKARGVVVQEPSKFRAPQEAQPLISKDKGKCIMIEPNFPLKRKDQIALDEQIARDIQAKLDAELIEEQKLARKQEEEANIALIGVMLIKQTRSSKRYSSIDKDRPTRNRQRGLGGSLEDSQGNKIEQYFQVQDYALWDVIENGNSFKPATKTTTNADGTSTTLIPGLVTTKEKVQKKNDMKARSMLLMTLPNKHLMTFNQYKDAKTLFAAIQTRFGGNEATKKTLLKQMYENFSAPSTESLDSIFNRLEKIVKGTASSSSSSNSQNMAFVSSPSSTNEVNTDYGVSTANTPSSLLALSFYTASTQVRSTAILIVDDISIAEIEDKKVECFNCHKIGHFKRECRGPNNQDSMNRNQDSSRRTINVEETSSKAMLAIDGAGFD
ncbi:ribonuclease H-like domain-containing protein [Tanacetum coccineum]|uniref:Ribonuclease H-like domain-containing protein n=1 Tax=Tanacetum coccineum TaxID=301880 RepID=A0ABQ5HTX9_9ASTR